MPRTAHARSHPTQASALRRSPGDRGKRLGVGPRLPARLSGKQVTLLWGSTGPQGPALCTCRCRPSVRTEFKLSPLTAKKTARKVLMGGPDGGTSAVRVTSSR
ncbi:Hypothetical predicted protein [Lynx pardinus]|uniref:Uncharacterized protein n=1 Tax=Lynx pardinus TaxID=191816 RepID=A0A485MIH7_LYNPA|nr:Hypothetical predicted protein [Lynx pardinus]